MDAREGLGFEIASILRQGQRERNGTGKQRLSRTLHFAVKAQGMSLPRARRC
jgi:hypothetical protein